MKRSRNWTFIGVACLLVGTMGCGEDTIAPLRGALDPAPTGPVTLLVTNNTSQDVEVMVEFGMELVAIGLVEAGSTERFELGDGANLFGGYARIIVEPLGGDPNQWSEEVWIISGTTVDLTIVADGVLVSSRPSGPDDDCWQFDDVCIVN